MDGFKSTPKMKSDLPCFKAGGYVSRKEFKKEESKDIAADKQMVKMGVSQHESVLHKGEPKTELTLKKGGRAKKSVGTVNKYKAGGSVASESKKPSGDAVSLIKVKPTGDKKADAPSILGKNGRSIPLALCFPAHLPGCKLPLSSALRCQNRF